MVAGALCHSAWGPAGNERPAPAAGRNKNRWTRKDQPLAGATVGFTMLGMAGFFKQHQLMRLLISARAKTDFGLHPDTAGQLVQTIRKVSESRWYFGKTVQKLLFPL